ncbi:MAG: CAP domain-containing protein [Pyrinomonadaceae bacterium]|jgi:uncharacterized protein YkwD|nr:CAP domain-containing protein [Pyrinomonadaceae bacterium]
MFFNYSSIFIHHFNNLLQLGIFLLSKFFVFATVIFIPFSVNVYAQISSESTQIIDNQSFNELKLKSTRPRLVTTNNEILSKSNEKPTINLLEIERKTFDLLNEQRILKGLTPLVWSDELAKIARLHSENMAKYKFFSHVGLDGKTAEERARSLGVKVNGIGENISYNRGYTNPVQTAVDGWLNSSGHRNNLMQKFWQKSAIGVAVANDGTYYFTEIFSGN